MLEILRGSSCFWDTHILVNICFVICFILSTGKPDWEFGMHFHKTITLSIICILNDDCKQGCLDDTQSAVKLLFCFFIQQGCTSSKFIVILSTLLIKRQFLVNLYIDFIDVLDKKNSFKNTLIQEIYFAFFIKEGSAKKVKYFYSINVFLKLFFILLYNKVFSL